MHLPQDQNLVSKIPSKVLWEKTTTKCHVYKAFHDSLVCNSKRPETTNFPGLSQQIPTKWDSWLQTTEGQKSEFKVLPGPLVPLKPQKQSFLASFSLWSLTTIFGIPWLEICQANLFLFISWPSSFCVSLSSSCKNTSHTGSESM